MGHPVPIPWALMVRFWLACLGTLLLPTALAGNLEQCRSLRERRDALAAEAMAAEIALVQKMRGRLCPLLRRQADGANANDQLFAPIDYEALLLCRRRAEQLIERTRPVLYRNRLGFTFYTAPGADLAGQADAVAGEMERLVCSSEAQPPTTSAGPGLEVSQRSRQSVSRAGRPVMASRQRAQSP